ncbi:MAG: hypothetical protein ACNS63_05145 [Candidatus Nitrospinota bacterium M3_3B_026]
MEDSFKRPAAVTIIGMLYVLFGSLLATGSALNFAMMRHLSPMIPPGALRGRRRGGMEGAHEDIRLMFDFLDGVFAYRDLITAAVFATGVVMVFAAVGFLRLRPWGRTTLEAITWLVFAGVLCTGLFWLGMMFSIRGAAVPEAGRMAEEFPFTPRLFGSLMMVFGGVMTLIHTAIPGVFILLLRMKSVREAMR